MKGKKAVLGLDTVKGVFIIFLVLAIIGIAIALSLVSLRDVTDDLDQVTGNLANETIAFTDAGTDTTVASLRNIALSSVIVTEANATAGVVPSTNYTVSGGTVTATGDSAWNGSNVNVSASYVYSHERTTGMMGNITSANESFFTNTGTIYAVLIVVVIIMAIAIIIAIVSRFGGGREGGISSGKSYGSDTISGI